MFKTSSDHIYLCTPTLSLTIRSKCSAVGLHADSVTDIHT